MEDAFNIYYDELMARTDDFPEEEWDRTEILNEVLSETHAATVDRLLNQLDWPQDDALEVAAAFAAAVKPWVKQGHFDRDDLLERLELAEREWQDRKEMMAP